MKTSNLIIGVMAVGLVGAGVFFFTREAAAGSKAAKAFSVSADCNTIRILDEQLAQEAATAAAISLAPSGDSSALTVVKEALAIMLPQCSWDDPPATRAFVDKAGNSTSWAMIEDFIGSETTVSQLKDRLLAEAGLQGAVVVPPLMRQLFGTGGCFTCGLGTGGPARSARRRR